VAVSYQLTDVGKGGDRVGQRVLNNLWRARLSRGRVIWLLAPPLLSALSPIRKLDRRQTGRQRKRDKFLTGQGGGGGGGRESALYDRKKAWSSIQ
jgi:hypothetical protein